MKKLTMFFALLMGVSFTGQAAFAAVPVIDGMLTSGSEWTTNVHTIAGDIDEAAIPDQYDLKKLTVLNKTAEGADNGLYFRVDMFDTPTLAGGPASLGDEAFMRIRIDFDGDDVIDLRLDFNDAVDPGLQKLGVYSGTPNAGNLLGYGAGSMSDFFEFYLPATLFNGNVVGKKTGFNVRFDDSGTNPDDFLPDERFTTPNVPEPATLLLMGIGLVGAGRFRKS